ncbi:DUF397 domain-containing protein [Actinomadura rugatobispora]|uniref:DUF397 domain-containing protein n=1 Tax=Actinomadura rugatobispora TaxID=1994 RepID=A0ABW0ZUI0_9ACTN
MIQWRKSRHSQSNAQGECIEVSINLAWTTLIRDSKNPQGPRLTLTRSEFTQLIHTIKARAVPRS